MKSLEEAPSPEETEKSPEVSDKIQILIARVDIQKIEDRIVYFFHMGEQLKVSFDKLTPTEWGGWEAKDLQEIHTVDPVREAIWQEFAKNARGDLADIFPEKIEKGRRSILDRMRDWL